MNAQPSFSSFFSLTCGTDRDFEADLNRVRNLVHTARLGTKPGRAFLDRLVGAHQRTLRAGAVYLDDSLVDVALRDAEVGLSVNEVLGWDPATYFELEQLVVASLTPSRGVSVGAALALS